MGLSAVELHSRPLAARCPLPSSNHAHPFPLLPRGPAREAVGVGWGVREQQEEVPRESGTCSRRLRPPSRRARAWPHLRLFHLTWAAATHISRYDSADPITPALLGSVSLVITLSRGQAFTMNSRAQQQRPRAEEDRALCRAQQQRPRAEEDRALWQNSRNVCGGSPTRACYRVHTASVCRRHFHQH